MPMTNYRLHLTLALRKKTHNQSAGKDMTHIFCQKLPEKIIEDNSYSVSLLMCSTAIATSLKDVLQPVAINSSHHQRVARTCWHRAVPLSIEF